MTFAELKAQFIQMADDPSITQAQAGTWINANYKILLRDYSWPFMVASGQFTTVASQQEYAFATGFGSTITDFAKVMSVYKGNIRLSPINYEERHESSLQNKFYITPNNLSIGLGVTPTAAGDVYDMDYLKIATDLEDDTDEPIFLEDFHWILIFMPLVNYQFQEREQSDEFKVQYDKIFRSMLKFYKVPSAIDVPRLMRGPQRIVRSTSSPLVAE